MISFLRFYEEHRNSSRGLPISIPDTQRFLAMQVSRGLFPWCELRLPFVEYHKQEFRSMQKPRNQSCRRPHISSAYRSENRICGTELGLVWNFDMSYIRRDQIDTSWKEAGLEYTKKQAKRDHDDPFLRKSEPNLLSSAVFFMRWVHLGAQVTRTMG